MSSPANIINSIPSSPSSSSSSESLQSTSSETTQPTTKRKKLNNQKKKNSRKHDKYLISAEHWTPIVGPSLPKKRKTTPPPQQQNNQDTSLNIDSNSNFVKLFDNDPSNNDHHHQIDQSILVTVQKKVSLYVSCFEDMLNTVLEHEQYLFSPSELLLLYSWKGLNDSSKYLFVRLFMRKHDNWFRLDKLLNYSTDIGEIEPACEGLCKSIEELIQAIPERVKQSTKEEEEEEEEIEEIDVNKLTTGTTIEDNVISELGEFLNEQAQLVLTNSPSNSEQPMNSSYYSNTDNLEEWCLFAGKLAHYLHQARNVLGIQNWSTLAPLHDLNEFDQTIPCIPSAVHTPAPIIITEPEPESTTPSVSPPALVADDSEDIEVSTILQPVQKTTNSSSPRTPSHSPPPPPTLDEIDPELNAFASMTSTLDYGLLNTDELFNCMNMNELKSLAKKLHANPHTTRDMIILGIKTNTKKQSTLFGAPINSNSKGTNGNGKQKKQLSIKFNKKGLKESQILSLNSTILKVVGPCIKLTPKVCLLFKRLHLIFYRSTTISEKTMTASILARMEIRSYPKYQVIRTNSIFDSRETLINYEMALAKEKEFDDLLIDERKPWNEDEVARNRRYEAKNLRLKNALRIFDDAWILWQQTVLQEDHRLLLLHQSNPSQNEIDLDTSTYYKRRFHPGWPLTRIMQKGLAILARFKEYEREVHVLEALLQQRHFRRGKRGQWYDRLALILMTKLSTNNKNDDEEIVNVNYYQNQAAALYTCEQGLLDPDTHQIYRFNLSKRLSKLQSILQQQQQQSNNIRQEGEEGKNKKQQEEKEEEMKAKISELSEMEDWKKSRKITLRRVKLSDQGQIGLKTSWKSGLDNASNDPLSVEQVSLEYYNSIGWRGFHSEGSILKMIFSLVFWNIIFAPIPGAFETPYQTAPLDIGTDAFAIVRRPLIEEEIKLIEKGGNSEMKARLLETYNREKERTTLCMGISSSHNWERFSLQDLLEILDCLIPSDFILISRVLFEDWFLWSAGVPDLCLWKIDEKKCKFVEVKGPGDKLSEQQKNWVNLLLKAEGIEVEICSVKEQEEE